MDTRNFAHFGNTGDVISSLPALKEFYRKTGVKPTLYLVKDHPAVYYEGAVHPVKNDKGENVSLNADMINMLIPLLKEQPYLLDVKTHTGEPIHVNLSAIRDTFCNIPFGDIRRWYFYVYPDLACDLTQQYIEVPETEKDLAKGKLIVCRTERYQNPNIDYSFLKKHEENLVFAGTMREWNGFGMTYGLQIPKLHINNFFELAQALKQSKGLLSNQTMIFQIAEGLKVPRIVELCSFAPNVIPTGEKAFDFYAQLAVENYVQMLLA